MRQIPFILTSVRIAASPALVWLLAMEQYREALALAIFAGLTDWFDGFAARKLGVSGKLGVVLDPLADKLMLVTLFLALAWKHLIPVWMLALVMGRDIVIVVGAILLRVLRGRREFLPSTWGKVSTFFQIILVLLVMLDAAFPHPVIYWLALLALALSALFTGVSWVAYVRKGIAMTRRNYVAAAGAS